MFEYESVGKQKMKQKYKCVKPRKGRKGTGAKIEVTIKMESLSMGTYWCTDEDTDRFFIECAFLVDLVMRLLNRGITHLNFPKKNLVLVLSAYR